MGERLQLGPAFINGLRRDSRSPRNGQFLAQCKGLRPTEFGLKDVIAVNQPLTDQEIDDITGFRSKAWPFPQIFRGKKVTLIAEQVSVAPLVEVVGGSWTSTGEFSLKDADDFGAVSPGVGSIQLGGGPWHFMDFHDTWMLFNGTSIVFNTAHDANVYVNHNVAGSASSWDANTGWQIKDGRWFMGGFNASKFLTAEWQTFFALYDDTLPANIAALLDFTAGASTNWIMWGALGGGDLAWMFSDTFMIYGNFEGDESNGFGPTNPYIFELWATLSSGAMPMPWQGTVQAGLPLGEGAIVYGDKGCSGITPTSTSPAAGGIPAMSLQPIRGFGERLGVASRSAMGGDETQHLMLDEGGELWRITPNGLGYQAEKLGYGQLFAPMLGNDILIGYDEQRKEFRVSDENDSYVVSGTGVGGPTHERPTTVSFAQGGLIGVVFAETDNVIIESEVISFPEITEFVQAVFIGDQSDTNAWLLKVEYKLDTSTDTAFKSLANLPFRLGGIGVLRNISGLQFKFTLTNAERADVDLENLFLEFSSGGKRDLKAWLP